MLNNKQVENPRHLGARFGVNFAQVFLKKYYIESGIYGKYNREKSISTLSFAASNLRGQVPFYSGYILN